MNESNFGAAMRQEPGRGSKYPDDPSSGPSVTAITHDIINILEKTATELHAINERVSGQVPITVPGNQVAGRPPGEPTLIDLSYRASQLANDVSMLVTRLAKLLL